MSFLAAHIPIIILIVVILIIMAMGYLNYWTGFHYNFFDAETQDYV